jgi:hypothetical protein
MLMCVAQEMEIRSKRESLARELSYNDSEQRKVKSKLERLDNEDVQRRLALQRADPDCIRAADWVKNNQHRLKRKVWGPIALEVRLFTCLLRVSVLVWLSANSSMRFLFGRHR